ncbi:MAG TPA: hypothetical protein VG714_07215 [Acidobacteriaceae bacterium]|nr:hypothetical protein [Acidobacteriaceae bacterium]
MFRRSIVAYLLIGLCGCGGGGLDRGSSSTSTPPPPNQTPALNGNWEIRAVSQISMTTYLVGGSLSTTGTDVSGILHIVNTPSCYVSPNGTIYDLPVTGTISTEGALSLTSSPVQNQTLQLSGTWSNGSIVSGTYSVTGGCGNGDHGTITGFVVPSFSGTYTGTFTSVSGLQIKTTIMVAQATTPGSDGEYSLSGTATFDSPCFTSGTIAADPYSYVLGGFVETTITTGNGLVEFGGTITDSTGNTLTGNYSVTGGTGCAGDSGAGTVNR